MSDHVPAWKKIGLKVKETLDNDPLAITTHLDSAKVTKKQVKQLNKRKLDNGDNKEKKPPKRLKLPKTEKPPPPERDQLLYLRTYSTDKENWKFSKQKQNWILKHIKVIEDKYEDYLVTYLEGIQGGGRERLVEQLRKVTESWNTAALDEPKKEEEDEKLKQEQEAENEASKDSKSKKAKSKAEEDKEDLESVDADYAKRARKILQAMTEDIIYLKGIDDEEEREDDKAKAGRDDALIENAEPQNELEAEEGHAEDKEELTRQRSDEKEPEEKVKKRKSKKDKKPKKSSE